MKEYRDYSQMLGITDSLSDVELMSLVDEYEDGRDEAYKRKSKSDKQYEFLTRNVNGLKCMLKKRLEANRKKNFKLSKEHVKLLKRMEIEYYEDGGDYVFIGVDGKRPFGNSDVYEDVARIIEMEYDDELSDKQISYIENIMRELPLALDECVKRATNTVEFRED